MGDRGRVDEPVALSAYDPSWPERYARERLRLEAALAGAAVAVEHIGSTAVPGLDAKPVVDLLVGVAGPPAGHPAAQALEALGYESLGEAGVPGRLYFRRRQPGRAFNAHVVEHGGPIWRDDLLLRDFLRAHPAEARAYADVKRRAAQKAPDSLVRYSARKAPTVDALLRRARQEAAGTGSASP